MLEYKNILFCTDYSEDAEIGLVYALDYAQRYKASLHILHVLDSMYRYLPSEVTEGIESNKKVDTATPEVIEKVLGKIKDRYEGKVRGIKDVQWVVIPGVPFVEILKYSRENRIDLIIMGAAGADSQKQSSYLSTVGNVSKRAPCHVMAIRNPEERYTL